MDEVGSSFPLIPVLLGGGFVLALGIAAVLYFALGSSKGVRPDLVLHSVKTENLDLTVVERGTLESADNKDIICKVKAGSKGNYATTIKWVIDDGTLVKKGQLIMMLDSSSLEDQFRAQKIVLEEKQAALVAAESNFSITISQNESEIATAKNVYQLAELDLEKYVGLPKGTLSKMKRAAAKMMLLEMETSLESFIARHASEFPDLEGEFQQAVDDVAGRIELAEADVEMWKDRVAYSQRMQLKGYLSPAQVQADESRLSGARESLKKVRNERNLLQKFLAQRNVQDFSGKVQEAWRAYDRKISEADAKEAQAESDRRTKRSVYVQESEKLRDIEDQLEECKLHAPQDGMVVYYIPENSRWSQSERGLIQQGASVQEGQKMMRIPDLSKMQVTTRVHEAMVSRLRGDDRRSTGIHESIRASLLTHPDALTRLLGNHDDIFETHRARYRDKEYYLASAGQAATVRVEAFPDKALKAHVRTVATVASSSDFMSSDVKVYQTVVNIDDPVGSLKPGMSAEVTIYVDNTLENVLAVPVQAIIGGAESGKTRKVFVMTSSGPQEREVTIGLSNEKLAEIREGLQAGDQVVLNPKAIIGNAAKTREDAGDKSKGGMGKGGGQGKGGPSKGGPPAEKK